MKSNAWISGALAGLALVSLASHSMAATGAPEASIPFADHDGIRDWNALDDKGIWVQNNAGKWFYGTFASPCIGLKFENTVGFLPGPTGTLDRWSAVSTHNSGKCRLQSLKASDTPPPSLRKQTTAPAAAKAEPGKDEAAKSTAAGDAPD